MSTKTNKELVRRVLNEWNTLNGDFAKIRPIYDKYYSGYIYHHVSRGDMNQEQTIQYMAAVGSAIPDFKFSIDDIFAEGDKVVARYTIQGTHKGTFMGIPATGKQLMEKGVEIFKIAGGKLAEGWDFPDSLGLMTQLGVIPATPKK